MEKLKFKDIIEYRCNFDLQIQKEVRKNGMLGDRFTSFVNIGRISIFGSIIFSLRVLRESGLSLGWRKIYIKFRILRIQFSIFFRFFSSERLFVTEGKFVKGMETMFFLILKNLFRSGFRLKSLISRLIVLRYLVNFLCLRGISLRKRKINWY